MLLNARRTFQRVLKRRMSECFPGICLTLWAQDQEVEGRYNCRIFPQLDLERIYLLLVGFSLLTSLPCNTKPQGCPGFLSRPGSHLLQHHPTTNLSWTALPQSSLPDYAQPGSQVSVYLSPPSPPPPHTRCYLLEGPVLCMLPNHHFDEVR